MMAHIRSSVDASETLQTYPLYFSRATLDLCDFGKHRDDVLRKAQDLFLEESTGIKLDVREQLPGSSQHDTACAHSVPTNAAKFGSAILLSTERDAIAVLKRPASTSRIKIITIHRTNSWSRMKITLELFMKLCDRYEIHVHFMSLIKSMGSKDSPDDEHYMEFYSHIIPNHVRAGSPGGGPGHAQAIDMFSVCYNIRHYEKHGRNLEDIWTCRQSVIYHRYDSCSGSSFFLVVQPPLLWNSGIEHVTIDDGMHPLSLHLFYLGSAASNMREYLNGMSNANIVLDQRVSFPKAFAEFDFDFSLSQRVQSQRRKLFHLKSIVAGTLQTIKALSSLARSIQKPANIPIIQHQAFIRELECLSLRLHNYTATTDELLGTSQDIRATITSILEFRNQELLQKSNCQLQRIVENDSRETRHMAEISKWTYDDSHSVRIATVIALVYLPANLVMAFFSTIFADFSLPGNSISNPGSGRSVKVYGQVWVALVSIVVLIACTGSIFWLWDRQKKRFTGCSS